MKKQIFLKADDKDKFILSDVEPRALQTGISYYESVTSTQDVGKIIADRLSKTPRTIIADTQKKGRGRFHRGWSSPAGGLWYSTVLFPKFVPGENNQLSLITAVSLCKTLERMFQIRPKIKWPNDIIAGGKKLAGILTETAYSSHRLKWAVIGVGLNVNNVLPVGLRKEAVSLKQLLKKKVNRTKLFSAILMGFWKNYSAFRKRGFGHFQKDFEKRSLLKNKKVSIAAGGRVYRGVVQKIERDGSLLLSIAKDIKKSVGSGTVISYE